MSADISFDLLTPLPGEDPVAFQRGFCDRLAGTGALTTQSPDPNLNRPILPSLCRWVRDGWRGLNQGLGIYSGGVPESALFAPHLPPPGDAGTILPFWSPRFPFEGASPYEWTIDETPWPGAAMGLPSDPPPMGNAAGVSFIFEEVFEGRSYWVRLDDQEVYVLVRRAVGPGEDRPIVPHLGFDPVDAAAIGIAWKAMREAADHLVPWWNAVALAGLGAPPIPLIDGPAGPTPAPLPTIFDGLTPLLPIFARWARGEGASLNSDTDHNPVFLWEDPFFTAGGAGSQAPWNAVKFRRGRVRGSDAAMHQLGTAGLTNWARLRFPSSMVPHPVVTPTMAMKAAERVAAVAGTLAHEMLHMAWRNELLYGRDWHSANFPWWIGPTMDITNLRLLRPYLFPSTPSVTGEHSSVPLDVAVRELDHKGVRATRHFTNYLLMSIVTGLLRNDPGGPMAAQHETWCSGANYASQHVCTPSS